VSVQTGEKLVYMANQIARNLALDVDPAATVEEHIRAFWSPAMITDLLAERDAPLDPIAAEACRRLSAAAPRTHG
jgi:formate dehydrogenase subunit delta